MADPDTPPVDDTGAPSTQPDAQPAARPDAADLRSVIDDLMVRFGALPDTAWEQPATELTWTCRETVAHLFDDFGFYAMQLAGSHPPQDSYVDILDPPAWRDGGPQIVFWPDPAAGTRGIVHASTPWAALSRSSPPPRRSAAASTRAGSRTGQASRPWGSSRRWRTATTSSRPTVSTTRPMARYAARSSTASSAAPRAERGPVARPARRDGAHPETRGEPWTRDSTV